MELPPTDERLAICLAFDPGVTTGWALYRLNYGVLVSQGFRKALWAPGSACAMGQFYQESESDTVTHMVDLTRQAFLEGEYADEDGGEEAGSRDVFWVALEDFILVRSESSRSLLSPVRLAAMYEDRLREAPGFGWVYERASDAKSVVTDGRLLSWGIYLARSGVHARDAQRHGALAMRKFASDLTYRSSVVARRRSSISGRSPYYACAYSQEEEEE